MNTERRCIQKITGSCMGCEVLTIVENAQRQHPIEQMPQVVRRIQNDECPPGARIQLHKLRRPLRLAVQQSV